MVQCDKGAVIIYGLGAVQIRGGGQKFECMGANFLCKPLEGGQNFSAQRFEDLFLCGS